MFVPMTYNQGHCILTSPHSPSKTSYYYDNSVERDGPKLCFCPPWVMRHGALFRAFQRFYTRCIFHTSSKHQNINPAQLRFVEHNKARLQHSGRQERHPSVSQRPLVTESIHWGLSVWMSPLLALGCEPFQPHGAELQMGRARHSQRPGTPGSVRGLADVAV